MEDDHIITYNSLMIMSVKITCIKKAGGQHQNPYVAITSLTWVNEETKATGTSTREEMYDYIKK